MCIHAIVDIYIRWLTSAIKFHSLLKEQIHNFFYCHVSFLWSVFTFLQRYSNHLKKLALFYCHIFCGYSICLIRVSIVSFHISPTLFLPFRNVDTFLIVILVWYYILLLSHFYFQFSHFSNAVTLTLFLLSVSTFLRGCSCLYFGKLSFILLSLSL